MTEHTAAALNLLTHAEMQHLTGEPLSVETWNRLENSGADWTDLAVLIRDDVTLNGSQLHSVILATRTPKPRLNQAARALLARGELGPLTPLPLVLWGQLVRAASVQRRKPDLDLICEVLRGPESPDARHPALGPVPEDAGAFSADALQALFGEQERQITVSGPEVLDLLEQQAERLLTQPGQGLRMVASAACGVMWTLCGQTLEGPNAEDQVITERLWAFAGRLGVQNEDQVLLELFRRPAAQAFLTSHSARLRPLTWSFAEAVTHSHETGETLFWRVWPWANLEETAEVMHLTYTLGRQTPGVRIQPGNAWDHLLIDNDPGLGELIRRFPSPWLGQALTDHKRWAHPAAQTQLRALLRLSGVSRALRMAMATDNKIWTPLYDLLRDEGSSGGSA